jgi:hypothetical protein
MFHDSKLDRVSVVQEVKRYLLFAYDVLVVAVLFLPMLLQWAFCSIFLNRRKCVKGKLALVSGAKCELASSMMRDWPQPLRIHTEDSNGFSIISRSREVAMDLVRPFVLSSQRWAVTWRSLTSTKMRQIRRPRKCR